VDYETLAQWQRLFGDDRTPVDQARLLSPVSIEEQDAIRALASYPVRLGAFNPQASRGYDESIAKKEGLIRYNLSSPGNWSEVVLKGIQIGLANPMFKSPMANSNDAFGLDLVSMAVDATPETEYRRTADISRYEATQDRWVDQKSGVVRRYTEFYRLAWRSQIALNTERSLYAAIIPPGPTTVNVHSMAMPNDRFTALAAGFYTSLPLDYFLRVCGMRHLQTGTVKTLPVGVPDHPLASALLLRTMRLNCLTEAHADLWADIYQDAWSQDDWAVRWDGLPRLGEAGRAWHYGTPLRTERARRSALVEIDALVAVWLGMDVDSLIAIYQAAFPVLNRYEDITWFDSEGWKIAGYHRTYGQIQKKGHWEQLETYLEDPDRNPPPEGYTAPFYKADRVAEYRQAHAAFSERLRRTREVT
jgi:hypothetical protein